jgi:hypothetical protein
MLLPAAVGSWDGTNGFRLMPTDPLAELPASATVTTAAGGHLTSVVYSWEHPDDGPQDGLLTIGPSADEGSLVALWGDSWHQKPAPMIFSGSQGSGATLELEGDYGGGWRWRIILDATDAANLRMEMQNVIPAEHATADKSAGPYPVMIMQARRTKAMSPG